MRISGLKAGLQPRPFFYFNSDARLHLWCVASSNSSQSNMGIYLLRWDD
jgi:hypothetical protein